VQIFFSQEMTPKSDNDYGKISWTPYVKCDFSLDRFSRESPTAEHVFVDISHDEFDQNQIKSAENRGVNFIYAPHWSMDFPAPVFMKLITT